MNQKEGERKQERRERTVPGANNVLELHSSCGGEREGMERGKIKNDESKREGKKAMERKREERGISSS